MKNVLVVAAHFDDEILGCGGTILNHVNNGCSVTVVFLTDSSSTQYRDDIFKQQEKLEEMRRVADELGFKHIEGKFKDMGLEREPINKISDCVREAICDSGANIIYTHYQHDLNADHRRAFEATMVAARDSPCEIYSYFYGRHVKNPFVPDFFQRIDLNKKVGIFKEYKTEMRKWPHERSPEAITVWSKYWGWMSGGNAAEPFKTIRRVNYEKHIPK